MQHLPCRAHNHVKPEELRSSLAKVRELAVQQCTFTGAGTQMVSREMTCTANNPTP